ncbi:D-2-hydroxyacid dehydrogenase [Coralliovum pocilloporae]|uniref:D-2-hydroxyacid dehydrogenase n=1 Tax=Coralliovum pocilloporae TaxID=3066369 RepID=UPI003306BA7D
MVASQVVLIASAVAHHTVPLVAGRFPELTFVPARTDEEIRKVLEDHKPVAAFSVKGPDFPGEQHRQITLCPSVKWVQVGGSGYDHLLPLERDDLTVTNCAGLHAPFLAETVMGAMIALNGNFLPYRDLQTRRTWQQIQFRPLAGQTLLVIGLGHIGGAVADRAKAFGMTVIGCRNRDEPHPSVDRMIRPEQLDDVITDADIISLHVRLDETTHHLFDETRIARMKPGSILLNTARGSVVKEAALVAALETGHLKAAYLDVFEQEPLPADSRLWDLENLLMTHHTADSVLDWEERFTHFFGDNLERWLKGLPLANKV